MAPIAPPASSAPPAGADKGEPGDGTAQSGYVTPDLGPFECDNCSHFQAPNECDHPEVISDPEVNGTVDAKGCCNFFKSLGGEQAGDQEGKDASAQAGDAAETAGASQGGGSNYNG